MEGLGNSAAPGESPTTAARLGQEVVAHFQEHGRLTTPIPTRRRALRSRLRSLIVQKQTSTTDSARIARHRVKCG